jgi:hypothetical protein
VQFCEIKIFFLTSSGTNVSGEIRLRAVFPRLVDLPAR